MKNLVTLFLIGSFFAGTHAATDDAPATDADFTAILSLDPRSNHSLFRRVMRNDVFAEQYFGEIAGRIDKLHESMGDSEDSDDSDDCGVGMEEAINNLGMLVLVRNDFANRVFEQLQRVQEFGIDFCYNAIVEVLTRLTCLPAPNDEVSMQKLVAFAPVIGGELYMATETLSESITQFAEKTPIPYPQYLIQIAAALLVNSSEDIVGSAIEVLDTVAEKSPTHAAASRAALVAAGMLSRSRQA